MTVLQYPENRCVQSVHTDAQLRFYRGQKQKAEDVQFDWAHLQQHSDDCTMPRKVCFSWQTDAPVSLFELSERADFSRPRRIRTEKTALVLGNLKAEQEYWWRVNGCEPFCFVTDGAPRWIYADGAVNIRDNGGWHTQDGRRIRQGMLFRGSEMEWESYHDRDPSREHHLTITDAGRQTLCRELGIKTDLDLRLSAKDYLMQSPLGPKISLRVIPLLPYYHLWENKQQEPVRQIFALLAEPSAYPIYYHCWGGSDRTGTVAFLLEGLLGVAEEDMLLDYELSSLSCWGPRSRDSDYFTRFLSGLASYAPQGSWQERCRRFLLSCGVREDMLQCICELLLEEKPRQARKK